MSQKFSSETIEKLKFYVYRLIDPRNGHCFYIGKGKGNRVFDHLNQTIKQKEIETAENSIDPADLKYKIIQAIVNMDLEVVVIIHRHGMDEETALNVEAALIDAYQGLTNIQGGYESDDYGPANLIEINQRYEAKLADFSGDKLLLIKINQKYEQSDYTIYDAVRSSWKLNPENANQADYILAVYKGLIVGVFQTDERGWLLANEENFPELETYYSDRYAFHGSEAPQEIINKYLNKRIPDKYMQKGASNPILYVNVK